MTFISVSNATNIPPSNHYDGAIGLKPSSSNTSLLTQLKNTTFIHTRQFMMYIGWPTEQSYIIFGSNDSNCNRFQIYTSALWSIQISP